MNSTFDYIIVGSGAGGSAAAYALAQTGRRVLLLEKGDDLPLDGSTLDINKVIRQGQFKSKEPWINKDGRHFMPEECFNLGGKTKWYGAALLRYARHEFEADTEFNCLSWPIGYDDLAPYYDEVEKLFGVHNFEIEPDLQHIVKRILHDGDNWTCEPLPLGLSSDIVSHPVEARHFDGFASVMGLKADAQHALLKRIGSLPNVKIRTNQAVSRLSGDELEPRRINGVETQCGDRYSGQCVILAAGALHSPRLVQQYMEATGLSKQLSSYHWIGRYCKLHMLTALLAFSPSRKTDVLRKTALFLSDRYPHSSVQPLGFDGETIATLMPRFVPSWLATLNGSRAYGFFLQTEDGSEEANRVIAKDPDNQSYPKLDYDVTRLPKSLHEHRQLIHGFQQALFKAGYMSFTKRVPLEGTAHVCGTMVTGKNPENSVVDETGKIHGMENLYVVDGSILPRSSRVNPSLTIYAWALRVAHLIKQRLESEQKETTGDPVTA